MAGTSKILTVSYGAFSCTLEGFDDPISKMREVAEYYRDLAARDRNFGALPKPDAEAQEAYAEARTAHHIEARPKENSASGIEMRQGFARTPVAAPPVGEPASEAESKLRMIQAAETRADTPIETAFGLTPSATKTAPAFAAPEPQPEPAAEPEPQADMADMPSFTETVASQPEPEPEPEVAEETVVAEIEIEEPVQRAPSNLDETPLGSIEDNDNVRSAIRGLEAEDTEAAADLQPAVIDAESVDLPNEPEVAEVVQTVEEQPRGGLLARLKGRFSGEARPRAVQYEDPIEPESREPIIERAESAANEGPDPVEAALAQVVAQEQRADRIERRHASTEAAQSDSVDRILEQTNSQLGDNDASRRRSTISQLKAAVQAQRARGTASADDGADSMNRFREDLEEAVAPEKAPEAPVRRMAPLMLVSEQRVDGVVDAVSTRRVSGNLALAADAAEEANEEIFVDTTPFIEYVATQDVSGMEDLTEAAAAFSIYVLGQPHFSRSQLMQFVESAAEDGDYSREAFLRSFGTLLRTGKVNKVKRGLFTLARGSRFEP